MGNKPSRRKSANEEAPGKRRKKPGDTPNNANGRQEKHISCPDLGGAVPYRQYDEEPKIKYNIYRSYRDLERGQNSKDNSTVDFRIYRRSTAAMPDRPQTLPRGFGRSKSAFITGKDATLPNGGSYMDWERTAPTPDSDYGGTLRSGRSSRMSKRSSIASSCGTCSKLTQVGPNDFPNTKQIKRKLAYFEKHFARGLVQKYGSLPESDQLASLALSIRKRFGQTQTVTLLDYLDGENIPDDLMSPGENNSSGKYILCIPQSLFSGVQHVRRSGTRDMKQWTSLASDIVMCIGMEAANELSRMYEEQIALMCDNASIRILANHAVECAVDYVRNNTYLDRNSVLHGVVNNTPPNPDGHPKYLAVILGDKELKWDLYDILKKNGLRREVSLFSDVLIVDPDEDTEETDPWTFHYASGSKPMLYGYRGQIINWNFMEEVYELDEEDEERFNEESIWRPDDFHRMYMPYKRLIGRKVMSSYSKMDHKEDGTKQKLPDLLKVDFDGNEERDEIQPVYRPIGKAEEDTNIRYSNVDFENLDLTRAQIREAKLSGVSIKNTKLLLADISPVEGANVKGADLSFSTLDSSLSPDRIPGTVRRNVVTMTSSPQPQDLHPETSPGIQETDLDESLPVSVIVDDEQEEKTSENNNVNKVNIINGGSGGQRVVPVKVVGSFSAKPVTVTEM